ncbi:YeeE/YedE family protein [Tenacibaculum sp. 190524A02b]|uniref:YeeE/YedE family protein n=1 Tax=Tenacibaculum vairaonense TaxID=3137860 RepID=A0ABM9PHF6_9FLAO
MDFLLNPWPWYVAGPLIAFTLFLYFYFGKNFGVSTNLDTLCTIAGAGKISNYFNTNWRQRSFSLLFILGLFLGGVLASNYLIPNKNISLNPKTEKELIDNLNFTNVGLSYFPNEIFNLESFSSILLLILGGFLIGFGTRYAGGCTSGHAITGLSSLQLPSLLATIGFFIGGLLMTWIVLPLIF